MNLLNTLFAVAAETESDSDFDFTIVTPGPEGFVAILVVAIAAILLIVDMNRRVRRNTYRGVIREELAAEAAEQHPDADQANSAADDDADSPSRP